MDVGQREPNEAAVDGTKGCSRSHSGSGKRSDTDLAA